MEILATLFVFVMVTLLWVSWCHSKDRELINSMMNTILVMDKELEVIQAAMDRIQENLNKVSVKIPYPYSNNPN